MSIKLSKVAELTGATLQGDPDHQISSVADLESATAADATFFANQKYGSLLSKTKSGVICIRPDCERESGKNYLLSEDPSRTFQQIAEIFTQERQLTGFKGIHPTAIIHETAKLASDITVGPYAVIDANAEIGKGTTIGPFAYVGSSVSIGEYSTLYPHTVIREFCSLGNRVTLQPGAVIGSCGFGFTTSKTGEHTKLEQLGNVIIEDDVEIGANSTIDRARFKTTRIGKGTKIDNLVQVAHNVEIGKHNIICAQTGIAGTTKTGRNVMMGGQVGVVGHLEITDFVMIATRGGVSKSIKEAGKYGGSPVVPLSEHNKAQVHHRKLDSYSKRIEALEKRLAELEQTASVPSA